MSWADDFLKAQQGAQQAQTTGSGVDNQSWTGGFINSALSAIPELFGEKPTDSANAFRVSHPWAGVGSELVGGLVPYAAMGAVSETAVGARLLGEAMDALPGVRTLNAVDNPVLHSAVREAIRYSPVEIARLGVGLGTTDNWHDYGNLFADVGLSTLITGGFGGIGGLFRIAGKTTPDVGGIEGAPVGLKPTFEYRMSRTPDAAPAVKGSDLGAVQNDLLKQVFTETPGGSVLPGQKNAYVGPLEGGAPETTALVNTLFKPAVGDSAVLQRLPLMDKMGNWNLPDDKLQELLGGLSSKTGGQITDIPSLAENVVFPRLITVNSSRAAGTVSKALDDSAMQWVTDGVMAGKEAEGGLHVMAVRMRAGTADAASTGRNLVEPTPLSAKLPTAEPAAAEIFPAGKTPQLAAKLPEPPKIAAGDQWLLLKTDKPQIFAADGYKLAKVNVDEWSKFRNAWRESGQDDFANKAIDTQVSLFTPQDASEAIKLDRNTFISRAMSRLSGKFAETAGLSGSETLRGLVSQFYDKIAPTVVNERRSPLFARLFGTLRSAADSGNTLVNRMIGGTVELSPKKGIWLRSGLTHEEGLIPGQEPIAPAIGRLNEAERGDYWRIRNSQTPADEMEKLTSNGLVSDNLRHAVELTQANDKVFWEQHLGPAFTNANVPTEFKLLEGYMGPRLFRGDHRVQVLDENGKLQWLASGTRRQAMHEAQLIIDEGQKAGKTLTAENPYMVGLDKDADQIKNISDLVEMQMAQDSDMHEVVSRAMRRMAIEQSGMKAQGKLPGLNPPKELVTHRTGVAGTPDRVVPSAGEIIDSTKQHYQRLAKFAAYSVWKNRFMEEAHHLNRQDPTLFEDLMRKSNQIMGYSGKITRAIDNALAPILAPLGGGSKPATKIATETNRLIFAWNLGISNPTFSLLNVLQPLQTVLPHLAFLRSAPSDMISNDMRMMLRYGADGKPRGLMGVVDPARVLGKGLRYMGKDMPEDLRQFHGQAKMDGTTGAQLHESFIGGQSQALETIGDAYRRGGAWEAMRRVATFTAERSEEMSRAIAFNSYYIAGKEWFGLEGDKLYEFMKNGTRNSMFGYSMLDRSRIFTGPVGSMFGLFKNWQMHFISSMFQYANLGWNKGTWGPLLWQFGVAGSIGGLGAMGPIKAVVDGLARWNSDSPNSYLWMQDHWHDSADEIYFGLPAFFGASLQASSTLPGTDVRNDLTSLSNFVLLERAKAAGKATGAAWDYATATGDDPLKNPGLRDQLMQAFAPRAFFRAASAVEGDYITSMGTGYPQVRDVNPLTKVLHGMGLNQVEVERQQQASNALWNNQEAQKASINQFGIALADAQLNGDYDAMELINRKAVAAGLPLSSIYRGAMTRMNKQQNQDSLSKYRGDLAAKYRTAWGN